MFGKCQMVVHEIQKQDKHIWSWEGPLDPKKIQIQKNVRFLKCTIKP